MPRKINFKIGDRVSLKDDKNKIGVVVWINKNRQNNPIDVHWSENYNDRNIRNGRGSYSFCELIKDNNKIQGTLINGL